MKLKILATALGAVALSSCGSADDGAGEMTNDLVVAESNLASESGAALAFPAQGFVDAVAGSDLYEIESGKIAQEKATAADLKTFGAMLVADHTRSSEQLKAAAAQVTPAPTVPAAMPADLTAKLASLRAASGEEFDRLFVEQQTEAHRQALDTLRAYASGGDQQPLREFAATAQPVVEAHLNQLTSRE